jgi:hypothetical protein
MACYSLSYFFLSAAKPLCLVYRLHLSIKHKRPPPLHLLAQGYIRLRPLPSFGKHGAGHNSLSCWYVAFPRGIPKSRQTI